jgi:hypothetical protein
MGTAVVDIDDNGIGHADHRRTSVPNPLQVEIADGVVLLREGIARVLGDLKFDTVA